jgi:hypothetical protein
MIRILLVANHRCERARGIETIEVKPGFWRIVNRGEDDVDLCDCVDKFDCRDRLSAIDAWILGIL